MITLIEALNYRCLRYVSIPLEPFHVLVGPNASGKTTFLDVVSFLKDLVSDGLDGALSHRTANPQELLHRRRGDRLELAVEARIPPDLRERTARPDLGTVRYEVALGFDQTQRQFEMKAEKLLLKNPRQEPQQRQPPLFPTAHRAPASLLTTGRNNKTVVNKVPGGNDNFYSETYPRGGRGWTPSFKLGPRKSALGNLPADTHSLPVANWFREYLSSGVQQFVLNSLAIRQPSPPSVVTGFVPDGSNLPWVAARLRRTDQEKYRSWIDHLRTALVDLVDISIIERPEDRHCYLVYEYRGGLRVPSWLVSDGTLRLTALTLPAYLDDLQGIFLIEEPENGIHPAAMAAAYDSLSSMYAAQVLLATHSPVLLNEAEIRNVLCFAKDDTGSTDIVLGSGHPRLREWRGASDLGTLLASGILG